VISEGGIVLGSLAVETDISAPTIARVPFIPITGDVSIRFTDTAINNAGSNRDLRISNVSLITIGNEKVSLGSDGLPIPTLEPGTQFQLEQANFGLHRTDVYRPDSYPIADPIVPSQQIMTGFDLTRYTEGKIFFFAEDTAQVPGTTIGNHSWKPTAIDIEDLLRRYRVMEETGVEVLESSQGFFDNVL